MDHPEPVADAPPKRYAAGDVVVSFVVLALGILLIVGSTTVQHSIVSDPLGPRLLPQITGAALAGLALSQLLPLLARHAFARRRELRRVDQAAPSWRMGRRPKPSTLRLAAGLAIIVGYLMVLPRLGYVISTVLAGTLLMHLMGGRTWRGLILLPLCVAVVLNVVFAQVLGIHLP